MISVKNYEAQQKAIYVLKLFKEAQIILCIKAIPQNLVFV